MGPNTQLGTALLEETTDKGHKAGSSAAPLCHSSHHKWSHHKENQLCSRLQGLQRAPYKTLPRLCTDLCSPLPEQASSVTYTLTRPVQFLLLGKHATFLLAHAKKTLLSHSGFHAVVSGNSRITQHQHWPNKNNRSSPFLKGLVSLTTSICSKQWWLSRQMTLVRLEEDHTPYRFTSCTARKEGLRKKELFTSGVMALSSQQAVTRAKPCFPESRRASICLPRGSSKRIPGFALLTPAAFALPLGTPLSHPLDSHTVASPVPSHNPLGQGEQAAVWRLAVCQVKPQQESICQSAEIRPARILLKHTYGRDKTFPADTLRAFEPC